MPFKEWQNLLEVPIALQHTHQTHPPILYFSFTSSSCQELTNVLMLSAMLLSSTGEFSCFQDFFDLCCQCNIFLFIFDHHLQARNLVFPPFPGKLHYVACVVFCAFPVSIIESPELFDQLIKVLCLIGIQVFNDLSNWS